MHQNLNKKGNVYYWSSLPGISLVYELYKQIKIEKKFLLFIADSENECFELKRSFNFFNNDDSFNILHFRDKEILPYDHFSCHQEIISSRLSVLYKLQHISYGVCIVSITNLLCKLPPKDFINKESLIFKIGDIVDDLNNFKKKLIDAGYKHRDSVFDYGDYAVRGSIIDIFPLGSLTPYRIDFFDNEITSIRTFDKESQRSIDKIDNILVLPSSEIKLDSNTIKNFRDQWSLEFNDKPRESSIYNDVLNGIPFAGIDSYLPMFYENPESLFDYINKESIIASSPGMQKNINNVLNKIEDRYQQNNIDSSRPLLHPSKIYLSEDLIFKFFKNYPRLVISSDKITDLKNKNHIDFDCKKNKKIIIEQTNNNSIDNINELINNNNNNLICVESLGRREVLIEKLTEKNIYIEKCESWSSFINLIKKDKIKINAITVGNFHQGAILTNENIRIITESEIVGINVKPRASKSENTKKIIESTINNLIELKQGSPIVHLEHGIGKYLGLENMKIQADGNVFKTEFLKLEYLGGDLLYVPVTSLHMISRYMGGDEDNIILNKLGTEAWKKSKQKAIKNIKDVASELLDIYSRRKALKGFSFKINESDLQSFSSEFPFEETEDQKNSILSIYDDMQKNTSMDRLICGDVGFGKTEVAMRAAFIAANSKKQVIILVPTTLLAQQHYKNFQDRFANWPHNIEVISRFKTKSDQDKILLKFEEGKIDILIGTHKLIQKNIKSFDLGLVIVDEEHRFGVRQKEKLKEYCANVDFLAMTATPIPRTLNMAMSGIRDLSIITSPPAKRLSIKTFVHENENAIIKDAILRELQRGGQIFYLHNDVSSIELTKSKIKKILPNINISIGHGQMPERQLEQVMLDFYHKKSDLLLCSTIIETGIDIPNANTIIIDRADKFGLAQLHQLRGRVGRSHHQAYAYLLIPNKKLLNDKAEKRLNAIMESQDLGAGFMLASHDLEIRGAGDLLGDAQSGQMQSIGFSLYLDMLERAVQSLKNGGDVNLTKPLDILGDVNLNIPALIPESYLPDVNNRLILYKRISSAKNQQEIDDLKIEMIDRFGLLTPEIDNLFDVMQIKLQSIPLGISKIKANENGGTMEFSSNTRVDPKKIVELIQSKSDIFRLNGAKSLIFKEFMPETQQRIYFLNNLLSSLS